MTHPVFPCRLSARKHSRRSVWVVYRAPRHTVSSWRVRQAAFKLFLWRHPKLVDSSD
ncbi:hypothetical protein E2C01_099987 [Portunus trituberculatus]|uniref:Uncharacterized protein n=1 Tax=Portunus trituberculatus TaxID=210409 RepID=A0A5B7KG94_PORTR|nr:hypothetical protein [Portunus trituberculatus]